MVIRWDVDTAIVPTLVKEVVKDVVDLAEVIAHLRAPITAILHVKAWVRWVGNF